VFARLFSVKLDDAENQILKRKLEEALKKSKAAAEEGAKACANTVVVLVQTVSLSLEAQRACSSSSR